MSVRAASLLLALVTAFGADSGRAEDAVDARLVVFPLGGDLSAADRRLFDAMLLGELRKQAGVALVPDDVREVHVEATRSLGLGCESPSDVRADCAAEVARLAGARFAIFGAALSQGREVHVELFDTQAGSAVTETSATLPPPGESFTPVTRSVVKALLTGTTLARAPASSPTGGRDGEVGAADPGAELLWWISAGVAAGVAVALFAGAGGVLAYGSLRPAALSPDASPADKEARKAENQALNVGGPALFALGGVGLLAAVALSSVPLFVE